MCVHNRVLCVYITARECMCVRVGAFWPIPAKLSLHVQTNDGILSLLLAALRESIRTAAHMQELIHINPQSPHCCPGPFFFPYLGSSHARKTSHPHTHTPTHHPPTHTHTHTRTYQQSPPCMCRQSARSSQWSTWHPVSKGWWTGST